jgi:2,5-diamino-6-(ribosylamino)-4(3H)-pyrimidinone 5'-phosphate reductase
MVGGKTLIHEDPKLTVKSSNLRAIRVKRGLPENPMKIGVVTEALIPVDGKFMNEGGGSITIFTTEQTPSTQISRLEEVGASLYIAGNEKVDLKSMMQTLKEIGIRRILVEGGGTLNSSLLEEYLVDEINLYLAPAIFGGANSPTLVDGLGLKQKDAIELNLLSIKSVENGGVILRYQVIK